jgi:hypothetical protein
MGKPVDSRRAYPSVVWRVYPPSFWRTRLIPPRVNPSDKSSHPLPHFVIRLAKRKRFNIVLRAQKIFGIRTAQTGRQD